MKKIRNITREQLCWIFYVLFAIILFTKITLCHYFIFRSVLLSSLWNAPIAFFAFWMKKIAISMLLACPILLSKNKWWSVLILLLVDIWIITNYIYFKANGLLITLDMMLIADNMSGYWSSVLAYIDWRVWIFVIITIGWCVLLHIVNVQSRCSSLCFGAACVGVLLFWFVGAFAHHHLEYDFAKGEIGMSRSTNIVLWKNALIPFYEVQQITISQLFRNEGVTPEHYARFMKEHDVMSYLPEICIIYALQQKHNHGTLDLSYSNVISTTDLDELSRLQHADNEQVTEVSWGGVNLVVICVESFESWALAMKDVRGRNIAPNILRFAMKEATLYADKITSQARYGNSGDGQMTMITGLLPISYGAACMCFSENTYPSWAHIYMNDGIINPTPNSWNIDITSRSYGFRELIQPSYPKDGNDSQVTDALINMVDTISEPFAVFAITQSMHVPFIYAPNTSEKLEYPSDMPINMKNYLNCVHYTDSCIGSFLDFFLQTEKAENTVVVITGDHTVFKPGGLLKEILPYAYAHNLNITEDGTYCPLIIYDQSKERKEIQEVCYQMDIYPTIMSCIRQTDYYWKGFGVNLFTNEPYHRNVSEDRAFELSDKLIRANYFETIKK